MVLCRSMVHTHRTVLLFDCGNKACTLDAYDLISVHERISGTYKFNISFRSINYYCVKNHVDRLGLLLHKLSSIFRISNIK